MGERIERPLYCVDEHHGKPLRNTMAMTLRSVALVTVNLMAIIVCGGLGGATGYGLVHALNLSGVTGALVAAFAAMLVATFAWGVGSALLQTISRFH
jgi:hypothetical protein